MAGRRSREPGVRRDQIPPSQRGYTSITIPLSVLADLHAYMSLHGLTTKSAAVAHLLRTSKPARE